jgi:hypothetical protein
MVGRGAMKIDRNTLIGGQPAKLARDFLADASDSDGFYLELADDHLLKAWQRATIDGLIDAGKIDRRNRSLCMRVWSQSLQHGQLFGVRLPKVPNFSARARKLIEALLESKLISEDGRESDGRMLYRVTDKGHAVGMKTLVPRMSRDKAETLLREALERIAKVNADPELLFWVTEARVFGSYLSETDDLGDLDLAIKPEPRPVEDWTEACLNAADRSGKSFGNYLARLTYPDTQVRKLIKGRSPRISIHGTHELDRNPAMGGKTVYTFTPPKICE